MSDERDDARRRSADPRMIPPWQPASVTALPGHTLPVNTAGQPSPRHADSTGPLPRTGHPPDTSEAGGFDDLMIRPFLLTGGRTQPTQEGLRVESLLQARPGVALGSLRFEHRQIVELCQKTTSVAELAAALRVPLGVARVLVSDLVADGSLTLVQRQELSVQMIERIRDRVRAL
jgi:Protein of unknown function (DUF742)